ncbi:hypothetical protein C8039_05405 [Halogeometricum sp. wsp3]|nr:hypothetical protein C8039_05405 [Halogeometricum sp. wsp3]
MVAAVGRCLSRSSISTRSNPTRPTESQFAAATFTADHVDDRDFRPSVQPNVDPDYLGFIQRGTSRPAMARWRDGTAARRCHGRVGDNRGAPVPGRCVKTTPAALSEWRYENDTVPRGVGNQSILRCRCGNRTNC